VALPARRKFLGIDFCEVDSLLDAHNTGGGGGKGGEVGTGAQEEAKGLTKT
jgi:hypothetical protein